MRLTPRQEKFAQEYVLTGNASEAYRRVYPKSLNWKPETVNRKAFDAIHNGKVSARIKELQDDVKRKFDISAERILLEQSRLALFDFRRLFDTDGKLIDPKSMPDDVASAVSSIKLTRSKDGEEEVVELKLWSKNTALDSLFKNKGLYDRDNTQKRPLVIVKDFTGGTCG